VKLNALDKVTQAVSKISICQLPGKVLSHFGNGGTIRWYPASDFFAFEPSKLSWNDQNGPIYFLFLFIFIFILYSYSFRPSIDMGIRHIHGAYTNYKDHQLVYIFHMTATTMETPHRITRPVWSTQPIP